MTRFLDGPAAGIPALWLRRAPFFLRAVQSPAGVWDALDRLDDQPDPEESIAVYRLASAAGSIHLHARGKGSLSGWFVVASYRLHDVQPADATARSKEQWRTWCEGQVEAMQQPKPE